MLYYEHLPGGTNENQDRLQWHSRSLGRDSNTGRPEDKAGYFPIDCDIHSSRHYCKKLKTSKVVPVLKLSTTPWRRMGECIYRSTFSWPRHELEVSGQLHVPAALSSGKEPPVSIVYEIGWTPEPVWTTWRKLLTLPELELGPLGSPAHSQSLYLLWLPSTLRWNLN
jgi:hypothetical protein